MFIIKKGTVCYVDKDCATPYGETLSADDVDAGRVKSVYSRENTVYSLRIKILGYVKAEDISISEHTTGNQVRTALTRAGVPLPEEVNFPEHWR